MEKDVRKDGRKFYDNDGNCSMSIDYGFSFLVDIDWIWDSLDS